MLFLLQSLIVAGALTTTVHPAGGSSVQAPADPAASAVAVDDALVTEAAPTAVAGLFPLPCWVTRTCPTPRPPIDRCAFMHCRQGTTCMNGRCVPDDPFPFPPKPPVNICPLARCPPGSFCVAGHCVKRSPVFIR